MGGQGRRRLRALPLGTAAQGTPALWRDLPCSAMRREVSQGVLVAHGHAFPRTHDLAALHDLCIQAELPVRMETDQLERLNAYAVQVRYPGDDPILEEAREAVEIAQAVRRWVRAVFRSLSREQES